MRERISNQQNCLLLLLLCWWPPNCLIIDTRSMNYLIQNSIIDCSSSYDGNYNQSGIGWERNSESESSAYVFKMNECVQPWVISEAVRLVSNRSWGVGRKESRCERVKLLFFLFQAVGRNPTCRRGSERIEPDSNTPTQSQIRILITTNSPHIVNCFGWDEIKIRQLSVGPIFLPRPIPLLQLQHTAEKYCKKSHVALMYVSSI